MTNEQKIESIKLLSYLNWLDSWVGNPDVSFTDYCNGKAPGTEPIDLDLNNQTIEVDENGCLIIRLPKFNADKNIGGP